MSKPLFFHFFIEISLSNPFLLSREKLDPKSTIWPLAFRTLDFFDICLKKKSVGGLKR